MYIRSYGQLTVMMSFSYERENFFSAIEETINDYLILLTHLMEKGLKNREDLIFSSDGSVAIKSAISAISRKYDKQYRHVVCTQHIMRNLAAEMARKGMSPRDPENQELYKQVNNYFWRARNSGTKEIASRYLNEINEICPLAYDYITKWVMISIFGTIPFLITNKTLTIPVRA